MDGLLLGLVLPFIGTALGVGFLLFLDLTVPHQHIDEKESEGAKSNISRIFQKLSNLLLD